MNLKKIDSIKDISIDSNRDINRASPNRLQHRTAISDASFRFLEASKAANTRLAYRKDWGHFVEWCNRNKLPPLPSTAEMIGNYLSHLVETGYQVKRKNKESGKAEWIHKDFTAATIGRRIAAISQAHEYYLDKEANEEEKKILVNPTKTSHVKDIFSGIKRTIGTAQTKKKAATVEIIRALVDILPDDLKGNRDRALLTFGFGGGFRRSELAALDVSHISFTEKGVLVLVKRSKTDQEAKGEEIGIYYGKHLSTCPVRSLERWIRRSGITTGHLFRTINRHGQLGERLTGHGIAHILKEIAEQAGFNKDLFSSHSLRHGFITSADERGKSEESIMRQTRHKSIQTMRGYLERPDPFKDNASEDIGL